MPSKSKDTTGLFTQTGHPLTSQEAKFIEVYVSGSTQTQAYREAYGETDSKQMAAGARKVIRKPYIIEEIRCRMQSAKDESIANLTEIMQYYTNVMRGDIKDAFGLEASLSERTKAAMELVKRLSVLEDRASAEEQSAPTIKIELDWGKSTNPQISSQNEDLDPSENKE